MAFQTYDTNRLIDEHKFCRDCENVATSEEDYCDDCTPVTCSRCTSECDPSEIGGKSYNAMWCSECEHNAGIHFVIPQALEETIANLQDCPRLNLYEFSNMYSNARIGNPTTRSTFKLTTDAVEALNYLVKAWTDKYQINISKGYVIDHVLDCIDLNADNFSRNFINKNIADVDFKHCINMTSLPSLRNEYSISRHSYVIKRVSLDKINRLKKILRKPYSRDSILSTLLVLNARIHDKINYELWGEHVDLADEFFKIDAQMTELKEKAKNILDPHGNRRGMTLRNPDAVLLAITHMSSHTRRLAHKLVVELQKEGKAIHKYMNICFDEDNS